MTVDTLEHAPPIIASAGFAPSRFQQDIFDYVRDGEGDIFVGAVAGSGKTTTLCRIADLLTPSQQRNAAFVAFNRHVVAELKERLPEDFTVRTIHSMGFAALGKYYKWKGGNPVDDKKYRRIAKDYVQDLLMGRPEAEFSESELIDNMVRLCSLVRLTLTTPRYQLARDPYLPLWLLCNRFNIEVLDVEAMSVGIEHMLEQGLRQADRRIDMDDMVYLAATIPDLDQCKFDPIMVAECLPYRTPVQLADGSAIQIGQIVERRLPVEVLVYDTTTGQQWAADCRAGMVRGSLPNGRTGEQG